MNGIRNPYCPNCHHHFVMSEDTFDGYERSGKKFYCPQGHVLTVRQNDVVSSLRASNRFLLRSEERVEMLLQRIKSIKGVITRQRNRLIRGCCPYCNKDIMAISKSPMLQHIHERHSG